MGKQVSIPNSTLHQDMAKLYNNPLFSDIIIISESQKMFVFSLLCIFDLKKVPNLLLNKICSPIYPFNIFTIFYCFI